MRRLVKPRIRFRGAWPQRWIAGAALAMLALALQAPARAAGKKDAPAAPEPIVRWVDAQGNLKYAATVAAAEWVWSFKSETTPIKTPALRLRIRGGFPSSWTPELLSADSSTVITPPAKFHTELVVDVRSTRATLRYRFTDPRKRAIEITLVIQIPVERAQTFSTPQCEKAGLQLRIQRNEAHHLFLGLHCEESTDAIDLYFFRSEDSVWNPNKEIARYDPQNRSTEFKSRIQKPQEEVIFSRTILPGGTADDQGGLTEYAILYTPRIQPKRFTASVGAGPTLYRTYRERLTNVNITQWSMTGKANVGYRLIPRVLDVAGNIFGNLFHFHQTPTQFPDGAAMPSARFYGINGRVGYRLPLDIGVSELFFLTGWYFWGMKVSAPAVESVYGVKQLNGPQLFLMTTRMPAGKRGFWAYVKLALISDRIRLNDINNREIAAGGGYQLTTKDKKPWSLTLDIAHARFFNVDNGMTLRSFSLGIQKSLW